MQEAGEDTVIRGNKVVAITPCRYKPACAADPGIHHHQMDAARGKEAVAVTQATAGRSYIPGWNGVADVYGEYMGAALQKPALELTHIGIIPAKIGDKGNNFRRYGSHVVRCPGWGWQETV